MPNPQPFCPAFKAGDVVCYSGGHILYVQRYSCEERFGRSGIYFVWDPEAGDLVIPVSAFYLEATGTLVEVPDGQ